MAVRWRGNDGSLNAGNSDFMVSNSPNELVLSRADVEGVSMETQACVDHSILAIFEDSTAAPECKTGAEEENETLLCALTEMLDSVEDDDRILSPFDTLPDTKVLSHAEYRDNSVECSLPQRLRPRSKPPTTASTIKSDGNKGQKGKLGKSGLLQMFKHQSQMFHPKIKKADAEVEVFTSTSLVSLVKLMHPYCLKLHVEEGDKLSTYPTVFSQEEVWRYERPTEECDEEINVVSDDEGPVKETKEGDSLDGKRDGGLFLKSVLLNGNSSRAAPSRGKKRVRFGPIQVASLDESVENGLNDKNPISCHTSDTQSAPLNSTEALENSTLEAPTPSSDMNYNKTEDQHPKGQTKPKSLSLQQYRQLRQKRQPQVEKQGNYTTKWPSVPEPPTELTPILCLQKQNTCTPKMTCYYPDLHKPDYRSSSNNASSPLLHPSEAKSSTHLCHSKLKHHRSESKVISPASPLPDFIVPESKKSPVKKPTPLSSDPPNPVLLPLPVLRKASPTTSYSSSKTEVEFLSKDSSPQCNKQLQEIQIESTAATLQRQMFPSEINPKVSPPIKDCNQESPELLQEMKAVFTEIPPDDSSTSQEQNTSQCIKPQTLKCSLTTMKEPQHSPKTPQAPSPDTERAIKCSSVTPQQLSPIDYPGSVTEVLPHSLSPPEEPPPPQTGCSMQGATADSGIEAPDLTSLLEQFEETQAKEEGVCENEPMPVHAASLLLTSSVGPLKSLSTSETQKLQTVEVVDIPEPLSTEIILSTQQPARRKNPPSKSIQIIDPRPLPSRKTHTAPSESPAAHSSPHIYAHVSSDHDYCRSVDHSLVNASQRNRLKPLILKDTSPTTNDQHVMTRDSDAASQGQNQITTGQTNSMFQHHSEQLRTGSEADMHTDEALQFSDCAADDETSTLPTPPPSPPTRGREKRRRYRRSSPQSDSSSSSRSSSSSSCSSSAARSPKRPRLRHNRSESSSCSSSPSCSVDRSPPRRYRLSYSRSRCSRSRSRSGSRSWSRSTSPSQSRSPSPQICRRRLRNFCSSRESRKLRREHEIRIQKLKAIDERRVVYVGRIRRSMTHDELRERFSQFGEVECVSLHFRDRGDHYGFVTFYNMEDAFAAIDNGGKLRQPDELPFDICFGGRRQFCNSDYTDLDANRDAEPSPPKNRFEDLDFDSLLKQAQRGLKR